MVPNGWEVKKLEDLCAPDAPITYGVLKPGEYCSNGIPLLQIKDLSNGNVSSQDLHLIPNELDEEYKRSRILKNDILISLVGTIGRVAKFELSSPANIHRNLGRVRTDYHEFIFHFLSSDVALKLMGDSSSGSSQSALNLSTLRAMKVPFPPFKEQQKIAQILVAWDQAISTTEKLLENSQRQKHALMQELLMKKTRLFDENGNRFSTEWRSISLNQICEFIKDGTHGTHVRYESGVPMLSATNITKDGRIEFKDVPFISEEDYSKIHSKYQISKGDILLSVVGTIGRVAVVKEDYKFTVQRSVAILRLKKNICVEFIEQVLSTLYFRSVLHRRSNSTAQAGVYLGELNKININLPELVEQKKIAEVLALADKQTAIIKTHLKKLKQEKKALMQQLLTGKKRVKVAA